jgi:hypothetical protein
MAKKVVKKDDNGFSPKYSKILAASNSSFMGEADAMSEEELKKVILDAEKSIVEQEALAEQDEQLKAARENAKVLGSGYKDAKAYQTSKLKYCLFCLDKMGK